MHRTELSIEGDYAVLQGDDDHAWLESSAVVRLDDWQ